MNFIFGLVWLAALETILAVMVVLIYALASWAMVAFVLFGGCVVSLPLTDPMPGVSILQRIGGAAVAACVAVALALMLVWLRWAWTRAFWRLGERMRDAGQGPDAGLPRL